MNYKEIAEYLNNKWKSRKDGELMKSLFMYVCDDLELLKEVYKDDKLMMEELNELIKESNGDFKSLYYHYDEESK